MLAKERFETEISAEVQPASSLEIARQQRLIQSMSADQQEKYLHLHEEAELLLQQLQEMKRQRQEIESRQLVGVAG
jgi:hypothetical protein